MSPIIFRILLLILLLISFFSCKRNKTLFVKHNTSSTNIDFDNKLEESPDLNILTDLYFYNGAGVATGDFNNDGLEDLYFTGNQVADKLYLNKGDFKFEDVTDNAGINNSEPWTTGVTIVDINNDGLLDIYICKAGDNKGTRVSNLLYINQGVKRGIPIFEEDAVAYGLDFKGFSTQATFFDFDLDSDLDMFLLNYSIHPKQKLW